MATWTEAQLANQVLTDLGRLPAGQTAPAEDLALVEGKIEAVYDQLNKSPGLTFSLAAIPTWAQIPLTEYVVEKCKPAFGVAVQRTPSGDNPIEEKARRELVRQMAGDKQDHQIVADYY